MAKAERHVAAWINRHRSWSMSAGLVLAASTTASFLASEARQVGSARAAPKAAQPPAAASAGRAAPAPRSVVGRPYGTTVQGLLTFRGNPSHTYYGEGPVPLDPEVVWSFPDVPMCSMSIDGGEEHRWSGTGWTGQPAVAERDGVPWVVFGAYDGAVHFLDGDTGRRVLPDLRTGDIVKGSVTVDPDGFPLVYSGSRDNSYRVIAIDGLVPSELWRLAADDVSPVLWNDDWDGAGLIIDDHLVIGGENSQWHIVKLNRSIDDLGMVSVRPELVFHAPGWDQELLQALGDAQVSIENSVAMWQDTVYFANSGGLVQG